MSSVLQSFTFNKIWKILKKFYHKDCTLYESPLVPRIPGDLVPHDAGAARVSAAGPMPACGVEAAHAVW